MAAYNQRKYFTIIVRATENEKNSKKTEDNDKDSDKIWDLRERGR